MRLKLKHAHNSILIKLDEHSKKGLVENRKKDNDTLNQADMQQFKCFIGLNWRENWRNDARCRG